MIFFLFSNAFIFLAFKKFICTHISNMLLCVPNSYTVDFRIRRMFLNFFQAIQLHLLLYCSSLYSRSIQLLHSIQILNYLDVMNSFWSHLNEALHHPATYDKTVNEPLNTHLTCNIQIKDSHFFKNLILKIDRRNPCRIVSSMYHIKSGSLASARTSSLEVN